MDYDDIINHAHHVSRRHPQMPLENRAAQFAPFSALTGYEEALKKVAEKRLDFFGTRGNNEKE